MMRPFSSAQLRRQFLEYFDELGHRIVPSAPLPTPENPTLFFTNAGMNQFVDTFLGKEERPYKRATSAQKCMRVQGKHNDLENVGPSPRHHTFFEMLGNFSFGDYFKGAAIRYACDFLTRVCEIPADRLWYTVHSGDDEAERIWLEEIGVPAERVLRMGDKTNFWTMGDVGPCGPTSEIHYDWGPEACTCHEDNCSVLLDNDCGRWLEVWNLVFMQFNQSEDGSRTPLPRPGVDTGMGLERLASVVQQTPVNYDNDLFAGAMNRIQALLGDDDDARARHTVGYRVIADHGRAATFLIADGVLPGNVGGSYVLRMIIRRAARFGRSIGFDQPFLGEIARVYVDQMSEAYPELRQRREHIVTTLTLEEERFDRTLESALARLDEILADLEAKGGDVVDGQTAFDLYSTHGLPLEITRDVVGERGCTVDEAGYNAAREAHALASGAGVAGAYEVESGIYSRLYRKLLEDGRLAASGVEYDPYGPPRLEATLLAIFRDSTVEESASPGDAVQLITDVTNFYVEGGGEVSDTGHIRQGEATVRVDDTRRPFEGLIVHVGEVIAGEITVGEPVTLAVDDGRRQAIRRNHTATHLLHRELRSHLGAHVTQHGSLVAPDRLRFDFSHPHAVDRETLGHIEEAINKAIRANQPVHATHMPLSEATAGGAMALFDEKYGDVVRTVRVGDLDRPYSFELCGGLHVAETGEIGLFRFTGESAIGAGLRRVEAITGPAAYEQLAARAAALERLATRLNSPVDEIETRLEALQEENRALKKQVARLQKQGAREQFETAFAGRESLLNTTLLAASVDVGDADALREMADWFRDRAGTGVAAFGSIVNGRPLLVVTVTDDLVARGLKAGDIVRELAPIVGGGGGGRPTLAQAGGKDAAKLPQALDALRPIVVRTLA